MSLNMQNKRLSKQQGGALAIAVFVIVVMTLLTVAISRNISASTEQSVQEVLGTRALMMAESANDIALAALFPIANGSAATVGTCTDVTTSVSNTTFNNSIGFANCAVSTSCQAQTTGGEEFFLIRSRGVCKSTLTGGSADLSCQNTDRVCASREVEIEAKAL